MAKREVRNTVYDLYRFGKIETTYQSLGKAKAACARIGFGAHIKKRIVKAGCSPRWDKPAPRVPFCAGAELARAAAGLFGLNF